MTKCEFFHEVSPWAPGGHRGLQASPERCLPSGRQCLSSLQTGPRDFCPGNLPGVSGALWVKRASGRGCACLSVCVRVCTRAFRWESGTGQGGAPGVWTRALPAAGAAADDGGARESLRGAPKWVLAQEQHLISQAFLKLSRELFRALCGGVFSTHSPEIFFRLWSQGPCPGGEARTRCW